MADSQTAEDPTAGVSPEETPEGAVPPDEVRAEAAPIGAFTGDAPLEGSGPTRRPSHWRWLWSEDVPFPVRSHRGLLGRLLVAVKRLLRPLVKVPQNDLWERQRVYNLILVERLELLERMEHRLSHVEAFLHEGLGEVVRHNDALFARVDQRLDRYRREAQELVTALQSALVVAPEAPAASDANAAATSASPERQVDRLRRALDERAYLELEHRYRGTRDDIEARIERYLPYLEPLRDQGPVLDLGCGRGEALAVLAGHGLDARGVDSSAEMVERCRQRGLRADEGDLFDYLAQVEKGSLAAVVSFHVIEHLPADSLDRLVQLAYRALAPGGRLILETPNPLSVIVAARNFWLDPTHQRPIHPASLRLSYELAGFAPVEMLELRPFADADRLPELDLAELPAGQHDLADKVNRLRDRLDEVLFGYQDYGLVGDKTSWDRSHPSSSGR